MQKLFHNGLGRTTHYARSIRSKLARPKHTQETTYWQTMSDEKDGRALGQPRDQRNEHAREPYETPTSRRAGAWRSESLRSDSVEFAWLACALQATGSPQVSTTHSSLASSSGTDADSLGTLSSVADSLASSASTVSFTSVTTSTVYSRTFGQGQGDQGQHAHGALGAGPEFSWESSYRRSRLPAAWPSAPGSAPSPAARGHGHISTASGAPGSEREMERSSQVGPMTKKEARGARSSSSLGQAQWTAAQTPQSHGHGRQHRHQPYARPDPSNTNNTSRQPFEASSFDDLKSFHHVEAVPEAAAAAPAASGAAWSEGAARRPDARSDCDDGDLTLGPGAPSTWTSRSPT